MNESWKTLERFYAVTEPLANPRVGGAFFEALSDDLNTPQAIAEYLVRQTIGPLTRAAFWEIIAIPDIRNQCAELAARLARVSETSIAARSS